VGNIHARKTPLSPQGLRPALSLLPAQDVLTLVNDFPGGTAWNCQEDLCGEHSMPIGPIHQRGIVLGEKDRAGYDGHFSVGSKYATSSPAANHNRTIDDDVSPLHED
jgi:hypothetical protein